MSPVPPAESPGPTLRLRVCGLADTCLPALRLLEPLGASMRRRHFFGVLCAAAAWPLAVQAQDTTKLRRIGVLWHAGSADEEGRYFKGLTEGLRDLGYKDGQNVLLAHRFPNEIPARFRSMAAELVSMKVDVLSQRRFPNRVLRQ